jgi:hypothetical protein
MVYNIKASYLISIIYYSDYSTFLYSITDYQLSLNKIESFTILEEKSYN